MVRQIGAQAREVILGERTASGIGVRIVRRLRREPAEHDAPSRRPRQPGMTQGENHGATRPGEEPACDLRVGKLIGALLDDVAPGEGRCDEPCDVTDFAPAPIHGRRRLMQVAGEAATRGRARIAGEQKERPHQRRPGPRHADDQRSAPGVAAL